MTAEELGTYALREPEDGLVIQVRILGARTVYGRDELLVVPASGEGEKWVRADRVERKEK